MGNLVNSNRDSWDRFRSQQSRLCPFESAIRRSHATPRSRGTYGLKSEGSRPKRVSPIHHHQPLHQTTRRAISPGPSSRSLSSSLNSQLLTDHWPAPTPRRRRQPISIINSQRPLIHSPWQLLVNAGKRDALLQAQRSPTARSTGWVSRRRRTALTGASMAHGFGRAQRL